MAVSVPSPAAEAHPTGSAAPDGTPDFDRARWHWFESQEDVPWDAWEALPGGTAYLDCRYLTAMKGHGKVRCRLGMIKADGGPWLGGIASHSMKRPVRSQ